MNLAVVVLNYNGEKLLEVFLPELVKCTPNADIYVIDNASSDDSLKLLTKYPTVKTICLKQNMGYAGGYNQGLKQIDTDVVCLINSDVLVTNYWTEPIMQLFDRNELIGAIQPKICSYHNREMFEYSGAAGGFLDYLGYPYCNGRVFDKIEQDLGQYNTEQQIFWASGACFFIRKKLFDEIGGFDEDFFAHQEEIDLCWRLQILGKKIYYTPNSKIYHIGGATLGDDNPEKTYLNFRNNLCMLLKNLPFSEVFFIIFIRLCLDGIAGIKFFFEGKISHTWAIIRAHFAFYKLSIVMWKKRISSVIPIKRSPKSIVLNHFILNKQ